MTLSTRLRPMIAFGAGLTMTIAGAVALQSSGAGAIDDDESTFVPIAPCRLFDTRPGIFNVGIKQTPLGPADAHAFQVTGTNGECTIPADAAAVALNLTAASATTGTNLRVYPVDEPVPNTAALNVSPGATPVNNKIDVGLSDGGAIGVYNRFGSVHVVGDVFGYFVNDGLADLAAQVAQVDIAQPFATTAVDNTKILSDVPQAVVSTSLIAPVDGQVTVNSTATIVEDDAGDAVRCTITDQNTLNDGPFRQVWESPGANGDRTQIAGTRVLNVDAGVVFTVNLVCDHEEVSGAGDGAEITGSVLTAIFTPAA